MSSTSNPPPTYKQALLREPPDHGRYTDLCEPRDHLAGHPLAPFLTVPNCPHSNRTWAPLWTPSPFVVDSIHPWSSQPPGQPRTLGRPTTFLPIWSTLTSSHANTQPPLPTLLALGFTVSSCRNRLTPRTRYPRPARWPADGSSKALTASTTSPTASKI
jgi:hypothetical protein